MLEAFICNTGENILVRTPYHETIVAMFKEYSGHAYDQNENYHVFSLQDEDKIVQQRLGLNVNVTQVKKMPKPEKKEAAYAVDGERILVWIPYSETLRLVMKKLNARFDSETCYYNIDGSLFDNMIDEFSRANHPIVEGKLPPPKQRKIEVFEIINQLNSHR